MVGAASIWHRMRRAGQSPPSVRTVHRVAGPAGNWSPGAGETAPVELSAV